MLTLATRLLQFIYEGRSTICAVSFDLEIRLLQPKGFFFFLAEVCVEDSPFAPEDHFVR